MRILFTIHHHLDPNAGAPGVTLKLGEQYQALGHEVKYFSFDNLPQFLPELSKTVLFPEFAAVQIAHLVKTWDVDVVDASSGDAWVWGKLLNHLPWRKRPLLVTQSHGLEHTMHLGTLEEVRHGNLHLSWKYPIYNGGFRLWEGAESFRHANLVFMLNRFDADYAIEHLRVDACRVRIIANGIPQGFLNLPYQSIATSQQFQLQIAQVGTAIARKGTQYSIPALNRVLKRYPNVSLSWFGTGCPEAETRAAFDAAVQERLQIVPRYAHEALPGLLLGHHILLFPSLSEGFPLAVPEAMACGLAPIVTDIPGPTEIVVNDDNGIVIPVRDGAAIEHALDSLINQIDRLEFLRFRAYTTAQSYSWEDIAKERLVAYDKSLDERKDFQ